MMKFLAARDETYSKESSKMVGSSANKKFSEAFHAFIDLCLQLDPNNRPGANELLSHEFFKQCRKTDITLFDILKSVKPLNERFVDTAGNLNKKSTT